MASPNPSRAVEILRPAESYQAMKKLLAAVSLGMGLLAASAAVADGTIYDGSRVGMEVDVVSMSGLNTSNAVIQTKHTPKNAARFCREYGLLPVLWTAG